MQNFARTVKQMRVNFFVRIIDNRQKFRHQIDQLLPNLKDMGSDNTVQLRSGVFRRLCRHGCHQIVYRFGTGQVHFSGEKRPPGKFAGFCLYGALANSADRLSDSTAGEPWH